MAEGLAKNLAWCVIVIATALAASVPAATAGRLTVRNEIRGAKGRYRILSVRCWSLNDKLGLHEVFPDQSKSWEFQAVDFWPFAYTEFRCQFRTGFGTTEQDNIVVYKAETPFLWECDKPAVEECVWVAKRDGLYHRTKVAWFKERHYKDVLISKWSWRW